MNAYRTSLFGATLSLVLLTACSGADPSADSSESASSDLTKTPAPGPTTTATGTAPTPTPLPPVPTPPSTCSTGAFGNAKGICTPDAQMLASAEADCTEGKELITTFSPDEACGAGSSNSATYTCCAKGTQPPPPPPPINPLCTEGGFANANGVCDPDAQLEASAAAQCKSQGMSLTTFTPDEKCGKGSSDGATYSCCNAAVLPTPADSP